LHLAGPDVQEIFSTLPDTGDVKDYKKAVDPLNLYLILKVDTTYARHCFRKLTQAPGETMRQFATRLRQAAKDCNYGEETDNQICDEILCKCTSPYIKRKLLEEGQGLILGRALEIAENCEKVDSQLVAMSSQTTQGGSEVANYVKGKKNDSHNGKKKQAVGQDKNCYRCGKSGHFGRDPSCPARGKVCRRCGFKDHFEIRCKSKVKQEENNSNKRQQRRNTANMVNPEEEDSAYAFVVGNIAPEKVEVTVGGCQLDMIIDSGASVNIVDKQSWEWLKKNHIVCI
jgi:hypothetical protein